MSKDLTICIPAYNEEDSIGRTLRELRSLSPESEILVVDDGSSDATRQIAASVQGVRVLSHERNRGYGAALKTGMRSASRKAILWYDADGQHRVEDVKRLIEPVLEGKKDVVIGVRKYTLREHRDRLPGKLALKFIAELIARERVPDVNSGLRCFRADVIKRYLHLLPDGFSASTTSTLLLMKRGYRVGYEDIVTQKRIGKSTVRIFSDGLKAIQLMVRILVLFEAFGFFTVLSLLQIIPGSIYGFYIALTMGRGFPALASTVIISGVFTFFMGILCDQITELRKEKFEE
jgi:glycosyltransferase involved in cell wall biosynthesis